MRRVVFSVVILFVTGIGMSCTNAVGNDMDEAEQIETSTQDFPAVYVCSPAGSDGIRAYLRAADYAQHYYLDTSDTLQSGDAILDRPSGFISMNEIDEGICQIEGYLYNPNVLAFSFRRIKFTVDASVSDGQWVYENIIFFE